MVDEKTCMTIHPRRISNRPITGLFTLYVPTFVFYYIDKLQLGETYA